MKEILCTNWWQKSQINTQKRARKRKKKTLESRKKNQEGSAMFRELNWFVQSSTTNDTTSQTHTNTHTAREIRWNLQIGFSFNLQIFRLSLFLSFFHYLVFNLKSRLLQFFYNTKVLSLVQYTFIWIDYWIVALQFVTECLQRTFVVIVIIFFIFWLFVRFCNFLYWFGIHLKT